MKVTKTSLSEIIKGNQRITADTAVRLSAYFGNSAKFWLGLQDDYDIENELQEKSKEISQISRLKPEETL
ncbi:MAG: addiction module antidote protein, HigA family [Chitinophagaceae bacterium]|nr:MAG: addiction module antidote protein, HigA family [Chitinophagaceae bacterium]